MREAAGPSFPLLADPAVRHGADAAITLALGADAAVPGRAYRYGLTPAANPASTGPLDLISRQFKSTLQFLGLTSVAEPRKHGRDLLTRG